MTNWKGALQEFLQGRGEGAPDYGIVSTGASHYPTLRCAVTVSWEGRELSEEVERKGCKKKDVQQVVAERMLQRLRGGKGQASQQRRREAGLLPPAVAERTLQRLRDRGGEGQASPQRRREAGPLRPAASLRDQSQVPSTPAPARLPARLPARIQVPGDVRQNSLSPTPPRAVCASPPSRSPPSPRACGNAGGRSPVSILQERLQALSLSPPTYEEKACGRSGLSPPLFKMSCVVCNSRRQPILEVEGDGPSKQSAKEAAAKSMLRKVEDSLSRGTFGHLASLPARAGPAIPEVVDPGLDEDLEANLSPYSPHYQTWQSPGEVPAHTHTHPLW